MQHPNSRDQDATSKGAQTDAEDEWPSHATQEPSRPVFDTAPGIVSAAIAKARAHVAASHSIPAPAKASEDDTLPMSDRAAKWPGYYPEFATRSALFSCARNGSDDEIRRRFIKIAGRQGETVTLETLGPLLTMADKDVWEIALDIARERGASYGRTFEAPMAEFARRMGLEPSAGSSAAKIRGGLERLAACSVELADGSTNARGRMLARVDRSGHALRIELDPGLIERALCGTKLFKIDSARRRSLKSQLARWMHDFLSTHSAAQSLDLAYMREICGHRGQRSEFGSQIRAALAEVQSLGATAETRPLGKVVTLDEATSSSDEWILRCEPGCDKPQFRMPIGVPERKPAL